jgi:hypothetical protein
MKLWEPALARSIEVPDVIPLAFTCLNDHLTHFNRPLVPAAAAVPDIAIHRAERPVSVTTAARQAVLARIGSHCGLLRWVVGPASC